MLYNRITKGLDDYGILIPENEDIFKYIDDLNKDYYSSVFKYNQEQYNIFQEKQTVSGITDVVTDKLWWDFDSEFEPEQAKRDAIFLCSRLTNSSIDPKDLIITFSGNKGFGVELDINQVLAPKQVKSIAFDLAEGLVTFDPKMYNAARILRAIGTKHQKTSLYKIPLTYDQLTKLSLDQIFSLAKSVPDHHEDMVWSRVDLSESILKLKSENKETLVTKPTTYEMKNFDFRSKPKFLSNCRWSLQNGYFKEGDRNTAFLCLASTYKNLGFDLEHVYRLLKGVAELQSKKNNCDRYADNELYNNVVMQVFGPNWLGGQYSCREEKNWLHGYCDALGDNKCDHKAEDELKPQTIADLQPLFKEYVKNIEKNTIKTGLPSLDKYVFLSTGANVGLIAAAGAGKTSIALEILSNTSKAGVRSVFASLDMAKTRIFEKVMYRLTGLPREDLYELFKTDQDEEIMKTLTQEFGNVNFFKKSSPTVQDIKEYVINVQEETGEKVKLVMIDYFERVNSDMSDDTAASKSIAGELQDLVDDLDICLITLVQPNKNALSGGADKPIYDYTKIKGSSFVYQAFRIILSAWRPFYNPKDFSKDNFIQMAVLKNDLGELSEMSFKWSGKKGLITELEDFERQDLEYMLKEKAHTDGKNDNGFF